MQLVGLEKFDTETRKALQRNPDAGEFLVEVTDMIATQDRLVIK
jgi:hypothetical protein